METRVSFHYPASVPVVHIKLLLAAAPICLDARSIPEAAILMTTGTTASTVDARLSSVMNSLTEPEYMGLIGTLSDVGMNEDNWS